MSWFSRPFGKNAVTPDAPHTRLADIEKQGRKYLDEADDGKWVYPACKRTPSDTGADKEQVGSHTRLEAMRYLLMVPRSEFRLLAEPPSQVAILASALRGAIVSPRHSERSETIHAFLADGWIASSLRSSP